jgi:hypothetical protein
MAQKVLRLGSAEDVLGAVIATGEVSEAWAYQEVFNRETRQQKTRDGVPVWRLSLISMVYGELEVSVPAAQRPQLAPQTRVRLSGLVAGSGRSGFWFSADALEIGAAA